MHVDQLVKDGKERGQVYNREKLTTETRLRQDQRATDREFKKFKLDNGTGGQTLHAKILVSLAAPVGMVCT